MKNTIYERKNLGERGFEFTKPPYIHYYLPIKFAPLFW